MLYLLIHRPIWLYAVCLCSKVAFGVESKIWVMTGEKCHFSICSQGRPRLSCAFAKSRQDIRWSSVLLTVPRGSLSGQPRSWSEVAHARSSTFCFYLCDKCLFLSFGWFCQWIVTTPGHLCYPCNQSVPAVLKTRFVNWTKFWPPSRKYTYIILTPLNPTFIK